MLNIREITDKDKLIEIANSITLIKEKLSGCKVIVEKNKAKITYKKSGNTKIKRIDYITSNFYIDAISKIEKDIKNLGDGTYFYTHDYVNESVYSSHVPIFKGIKQEKTLCSGNLSEEIKALIIKKHWTKFINSFKYNKNASSLILATSGTINPRIATDVKYILNIGNKKISVPDTNFNLVSIDILKCILMTDVASIFISRTDDESDILIKICDNIFKNHLSRSNLNVSDIIAYLPWHSSKSLNKRKAFINPDVWEIVSDNEHLFGLYTVILNLFNKDHSKSNPYMNDTLKHKYQSIMKRINNVCKTGVLACSIPDFIHA